MTERLRDDPSEWQVGTWNPREAQIAAALRIADRAKKRAEELQRQALAIVAEPPPLVPVFDMRCGFKAVSVYSMGQSVSLPFVTIQHGSAKP